MKLRMHTISVLMKKDIKLLLTNKNVLLMLFLPIMFAILYQFIYADMMIEEPETRGFVISIATLINIVATPLNGFAMMIAEEKEKSTLRVLMLSDVSGLEYLISKLLVVLIVMESIGVIIFLVTQLEIQGLLPYLFVTTITSITLLLFGAVIGLISKDQISTGTLSSPIMILFLLPPMLGQFNQLLHSIAQFVPTYGLSELLNLIVEGQSIFVMDMLGNYALIVAWIFIGVMVFCMMYRKRRFDN
ncbi:ABC transporter permease [[Eubacterium] hominis]|uniref:ABC transporter permease n=1 Tax=[Eubacterium] hominis TaxID=2764325 RepID=UPI003A4D81BE